MLFDVETVRYTANTMLYVSHKLNCFSYYILVLQSISNERSFWMRKSIRLKLKLSNRRLHSTLHECKNHHDDRRCGNGTEITKGKSVVQHRNRTTICACSRGEAALVTTKLQIAKSCLCGPPQRYTHRHEFGIKQARLCVCAPRRYQTSWLLFRSFPLAFFMSSS